MTALLFASVTACVCAALFLVARFLPARLALGAGAIAAVAAPFAQKSFVASNLLVTSSALVLGLLIGRAVVSRAALATFVGVAAVADFTSFLWGPTRTLLSMNLRVLRYLAICIPFNGHAYAIIGIGDLVLFTACGVAMRRCRYPDWAAFLIPLSGILGALVLGLMVGPVPALPILALAVLAYQVFMR